MYIHLTFYPGDTYTPEPGVSEPQPLNPDLPRGRFFQTSHVVDSPFLPGSSHPDLTQLTHRVGVYSGV